MIGKIIGAYAGSKLAKGSQGGIEGPGGAMLGLAAATIARRMSWPALLAITAGGYVMKRFMDGKSPTGTSKRY